MSTAPFLSALEAAAATAADSEKRFRVEAARRIAALELERAHAFRRFNFIRGMAGAMTGAEDEAAAPARAIAHVRTRLGWDADSEARKAVLDRLVPVAEALGAPEDAEEPADPAAALAAFEAWYSATHPTVFWVLFDTYMPETPVVDF